jgi:hypothetical protein
MDEWYVFEDIALDEHHHPRPGAVVHFHRTGEECNDRCYGVVINGRARTLEGTIQGTGV